MAWGSSPTATPSYSTTPLPSAQRRPSTTSQPQQPCASTPVVSSPNLMSPSPMTTEGRPPMLAGNHPSVPRERDQNRPSLGSAHTWGLLRGSLNGSRWGSRLVYSGTQAGAGKQVSEGWEAALTLGKCTHSPCAKSTFVGHVQRERERERAKEKGSS